jgi:serine/threonine protein kinase
MKFVNHVCIEIWTNFFNSSKSILVARDYIHKLATKPKQDYKKLFGYKFEPNSRTPVSGVSPQGIALLDRLLAFDHRTRPSAKEALCKYFRKFLFDLSFFTLADPYFENLHDPMEEPSAELLIDEHQDAVYTTAKWKCK